MDADHELEEGALSAYIFADPDMRAKVASTLKASDFTYPFYREVYRLATKIPEPWDVYILHDWMKKMPRYSQPEFLRLASAPSSAALAENYALRLRENSSRREAKDALLEATEGLNGRGSIPAFFEALESIKAKLEPIVEKPESKIIQGASLLDAFDKEHERMQEDGARTEFATPFPAINEALGGGLMREELTVVGGRPGDGKTTMALNLVHHYVSRGKRVLFASLEMGIYQLFSRLLAIESKIPHRDIMFGSVNPIHVGAFEEAREVSKTWELSILDDPEVTYYGLEQMVEESGCDILIVDYLQLVNTEASDTMPRYERVGLVSRSLKKIARRNHIPVLSLAQIARHKDKPDKKPTMDDLRESGNIEQDADNIWLMHVPPDQKYENQSRTTLIFDKNRNGPRETCELVHFKELAYFEDESSAVRRAELMDNFSQELADW